MQDFPKPKLSFIAKLLTTGLVSYEGEKWAKHRKIVNPAFHLEKLKDMLPKIFECSNDMIRKWEVMLSSDGTLEIDVWPFLQNLSCDAISRTAFQSIYEEGAQIFELLKKQANIVLATFHRHSTGWW
ncbi:hypothetical protein RIF29_33763 [Crotalaria pallida]|uniref:Cytochrome P450 n=1 Tax=Crotalaria pallida TaxID=3830 RepID=A0AAN9HU91_CROPI